MMRARWWLRRRNFLFAWRLHASLVLSAGGYYSCVVIVGADGSDLRRFNDARALWSSSGITSYEYVVRNHCFCGYGGISVRIVVVNRSVQSATVVATNEPVPPSSANLFRDIDGLFGLIEDALSRDVARLNANYDDRYGFPSLSDIDYRSNVADEEFGWVIEGFVVRE